MTTSIVEAIELYLTDCKAREQSSRTIECKRSMLNFFAKYCLTIAVRAMDEIGENTLEGYRQHVFDYLTPQRQKLDISTRRNRLTAVKVFVRRMFQLHIIDENFADRFMLPQRPRRLPEGILTKEEMEAIINQTKLYGENGSRDKTIIETYYASAIRRSEFAELSLFDIDTDRLRMRIKKGKGQKDRVIPIAKRCCESIQNYVSKIRSKYVNFNSGQALFLNNRGEPFTPRQLSTLVKKYVMRAGVDRRGACNLYRHTAATGMLDNGADIRIIQEQLGHADISTTQIYVHVSNNKLDEVYHRTHPAAI